MHKDDPLSNLPSVENTDSSSAPSDSATMDFPADREHQGIFSSNDTRIETENLPDIPEVAQQAPMSSISPALRTTSTVTGDLKLGDTKSRRSKKPLIIGGIVLAVLAVCVIVMLALSKNHKTSDGNNSEAEIQFNQFATLLLYGKSEDKLTETYEDDKSYELDLQLDKETADRGYWEKTTELLSKAVDTASKDQSITRYLVKSLQSYQQNFDFIRTYREVGDLDENRVLASFNSSGANVTNALIDDFYAKYADLSSAFAKRYADQRKAQYRELLSMFSIYSELGCVKNEVVDVSSCDVSPSHPIMERLLSVSESMGVAQKDASDALQKATSYLKSRCWELSDWLQNPVDERDGNNEDEQN